MVIRIWTRCEWAPGICARYTADRKEEEEEEPVFRLSVRFHTPFTFSTHIIFAPSFVLSRCWNPFPPHARSQSSAGANPAAAAAPTNANSSLARFNAAQSTDMASILRAKMAALRDHISTAPKKKGGRAEDEEDEEEEDDDDW
jgi:hypothetical protein